MNVAVRQRGNNNAYCQDEDWNWFDWSLYQSIRRPLAIREGNDRVSQGQCRTCASLNS